MPRRRRSRYAFYRRLRLLRETQHRGKVRRSILLTLLVIFAIPLMAVPAIAAESVGDLPAIDGLSSSGLHQDMLIFDRHGTLIDDIGDHGDHRIVVPLSYMSPFVRQASIAIEDHSFYKNNGVDLAGIARAAIENYTNHRITQGGSTISHQVLNAMVSQKMITPAQALAAENEKLQFFYPSNPLQAPHFVDYVLQVLDKQFHIRPSDRKGYRITTTLDLNLQHLAENVVRNQIARQG